MAERASPAVDIDLFVRKIEFAHGGHGNHGKGFVDLIKINIVGAPSGFSKQLMERAHRGGGKPLGLLRVGAMRHDARKWLASQAVCGAFSHKHHGGCTIRNRRSIGCGDGAILDKGRAQTWDLLKLGFKGLLITQDLLLPLFAWHAYRGNFPIEAAIFVGRFSALGRVDRKRILRLAGEDVLVAQSSANTPIALPR